MLTLNFLQMLVFSIFYVLVCLLESMYADHLSNLLICSFVHYVAVLIICFDRQFQEGLMATMGDSSVKPQRVSPNAGRVLVLAILEWLLIFLLFIDAIFAYLIMRFARYCELQTPCLLCSRLDHVFGNKRLKHYWDLICSSHKSEISSLVANGRCDSCNEPRILIGYSWELVKTGSINSEGVELRSSSGIDHLSHVGYNKLKVNSDSESEVASSDDESGLKHELKGIRPRTVTLSEDSVLEKLIDPVSATEPSSNTFVSIETPVDAVAVSNSASVDEISQPFDAVETSMVVDASGESKPIPVNDVPLSLNEMEIPAEVANDEKKLDSIDVATSSTAVGSHTGVSEESCKFKLLEFCSLLLLWPFTCSLQNEITFIEFCITI